MIIEEKVKDLVVVGEDTSKKAKISQDKLAKLQYLLTKGLYKDPIMATIAEWTNNGVDSVVQAGKSPIENPVMVTIEKDSRGHYFLRVEDRGTGLDDRDFEDICMNYLESTKENDNDTIGHFGIGMKSFLSLERSATFTCRKAGVERKYVVYEGEEFVNFDLVYTRETTEENGVIAELTIDDWNERHQFVEKAKSKLAYYDTAVLVIDGQVIENKIYRNELFQWSTSATNHNMHLCLKDVYYSIDYEALGISPLSLPVAIRLNLGEGLTPTPSRESYITNQKTKDLILNRIKQIAEWFIEKYNETVKEFATFKDAYPYLGVYDYSVKLYDNDFRINNLIKYADTNKRLLIPKVKGITVRPPLDYKHKHHDLFLEYDIVGFVNHNGKMITNPNRMHSSKAGHILHQREEAVLVTENFRGNVKEFLKSKYGDNTMFLRRNEFKWEIGKKKEVGPNGQIKINSATLRYILDLGPKARATWRANVEEWKFVIDSIVKTFKDETKVEESKEFAKWLEDKKERQRVQRLANKTNGVYAGLNKQLGDVTLAYSYERYGKIHFKKEAKPIASLSDNQYLTILLTEDDNLELAKEIVRCTPIDKGVKPKFALVGKSEIKKIPKHFQFINFKEYMSRNCKPFMRIASAIKFSEALENLTKIQNYKNPVFAKALKSLVDDEKIIRKYVSTNARYGLDESLRNIIIDVADEHKLYDMQHWDVYLRLKENIKKYDFITLISVPSSTNQELTSRYETLVNQILLFRKKFYNDLEGAKIVFEDKKETNEVV